jgi:hypothetical protein
MGGLLSVLYISFLYTLNLKLVSFGMLLSEPTALLHCKTFRVNEVCKLDRMISAVRMPKPDLTSRKPNRLQGAFAWLVAYYDPTK